LNFETPKTPGETQQAVAHGTATAAASTGGINIRRLLTAIVLVAAFAELSYTTVNMSAMPVYIQFGIKIDRSWIATCSMVFIAMEGLLKSPMGILGDRYGRKILMVVGPIVSVITALLTPHVANPYVLVFLRILDGVGAAALWPAAFSLIGDHVPEEKRAGAMSLFNLAYLIGLALGPALGGAVNDLADHYLRTSLGVRPEIAFAHSKEASFYLAAILFSITAIVAYVMLPNTKPVRHHGGAEGETPEHHGEGGFNAKAFVVMLGRMPMTLLMTLITFLGVGLVIPFFKVFTLEHFNLTESRFGLMMIGPALVVAALAIPMGRLGDKIGKARAVQVGIGICTLSFWMLIMLSQEWSLLVLGSLLGIGSAIAFPAWMALITTECESSQRGAVVGAVGTAQGIGALIGVVLSSFLDRWGEFNLLGLSVPAHGAPFLGCAIMLTVSFVLGLFTLRDNPQYNRPQDTPA
jgi:DHA1 family multidrug resistance protein-like MFS transporter